MLGAPVEQVAGGAIGPASAVLGGGKGQDAMTRLLHWSIEHSDPARLAELMQKYHEQNLTIRDVYGPDVIDALFRDDPSDMMMLVALIGDFRNVSISDEKLETALEQLQEYVDQVDNAGNLHGMGGLEPLLDLAMGSERGAKTRTLALWTLGVTVQNNPAVQTDLVAIGALDRLASQLLRCQGARSATRGAQDAADVVEEGEDPQYCGKLIFTLSGLVKNNATVQAAAGELGVFDWLFQFGITNPSVAVMKKSVGLLETVLAQNPDLPILDDLPRQEDELAEAFLVHVRGPEIGEVDLDMPEKTLRLINRLLSLRPMLFAASFGPELSKAAQYTTQRCESAFGPNDDLCTGFAGLVAHANLMLTARSIADEEL